MTGGIPAPRATLSVNKSQARSVEDAERKALEIYRQVVRRPVHVVERGEKENAYYFVVEVGDAVRKGQP